MITAAQTCQLAAETLGCVSPPALCKRDQSAGSAASGVFEFRWWWEATPRSTVCGLLQALYDHLTEKIFYIKTYTWLWCWEWCDWWCTKDKTENVIQQLQSPESHGLSEWKGSSLPELLTKPRLKWCTQDCLAQRLGVMTQDKLLSKCDELQVWEAEPLRLRGMSSQDFIGLAKIIIKKQK